MRHIHNLPRPFSLNGCHTKTYWSCLRTKHLFHSGQRPFSWAATRWSRKQHSSRSCTELNTLVALRCFSVSYLSQKLAYGSNIYTVVLLILSGPLHISPKCLACPCKFLRVSVTNLCYFTFLCCLFVTHIYPAIHQTAATADYFFFLDFWVFI